MPDAHTPHSYVFVRTDIALEQQLVQCAHAVMEAAWRFPRPDAPVFLVVLAVADANSLRQAVARTDERGVRCEMFFEPDQAMGYTAACSEPVTGAGQRLFRRYPLWKQTT